MTQNLDPRFFWAGDLFSLSLERVYSASLLRRTRAAKVVWPKHNPPHLAVCVFYVYLSRIFQCIFRSWHCDSEIWVKNCTGVLVYVMLDVPNFPLKKKIHHVRELLV